MEHKPKKLELHYPRPARRATLALAYCTALAARAQTVSPPAPTATTTLASQATLVFVPALVRSASGEILYGLQARSFHLLDNGQAQTLRVESEDRQPIALVLLLQTGASAPRHFHDYLGLNSLLQSIVAAAPHRVAVVTFDSQPEEQWDFTTDLESLQDAFNHPTPGDSKAALLDAVSYGIELLKTQPETTRRILLLLSQQQDAGSKAKVKDVLRQLGENNITVETVAFSPQATWLRDQFTKPRHENPAIPVRPCGPTPAPHV